MINRWRPARTKTERRIKQKKEKKADEHSKSSTCGGVVIGRAIFTGFYWVLLGCSGFDRVRPGFLKVTMFYGVLLGFTGFYWVWTGKKWTKKKRKKSRRTIEVLDVRRCRSLKKKTARPQSLMERDKSSTTTTTTTTTPCLFPHGDAGGFHRRVLLLFSFWFSFAVWPFCGRLPPPARSSSPVLIAAFSL